jgi:hypothetical protein
VVRVAASFVGTSGLATGCGPDEPEQAATITIVERPTARIRSEIMRACWGDVA